MGDINQVICLKKFLPYPDDYYRFSWRGIAELFPEFEWDHMVHSTNVPEEFHALDFANPGIDNVIGKRH